jgi:hypothetical protein
MKVSGKNLSLGLGGAAVGIGCMAAAAMLGWLPLGVQFAFLIAGVACWGLALGAAANWPWRGLWVSLLSAMSTLFSYWALMDS